MARPSKGDLGTTETITAKLTKLERRAMAALIARKNEIARRMGYSGVNVSSYIRGLIVRDLALEREQQEAGGVTSSPDLEKTNANASEPAVRKGLVQQYAHVERTLGEGGESTEQERGRRFMKRKR